MQYPTARTLIAAAVILTLLGSLLLIPGASAQTETFVHTASSTYVEPDTQTTLAIQADLVAASRIFVPFIKAVGGSQASDNQSIANQVLALVNAERARAGCQPLSLEPRLMQAAQRHSEDMAVNNFFGHVGSNGSTLVQRVNAVGYPWSALAENVAAGYPTAEAVMAGWMSSEGHRRNILNCRYVHIGVGYVYQADDTPLPGAQLPYYHYWTEVFGTPR
ncbi:MAG: CAP domain-containing protein [Oscillochloridaceae bacterium]|nr:CAP domain-containing protein [Chloroflexaceae bacterium]MDW8391838.1 CAP domain-containing protein [Oscillochloridaceae bacterium]